jgi:hypothetical protein
MNRLPVVPRYDRQIPNHNQRFCTLLDCVDVGFIPDGIPDDLPLPSRLGATRVGGVDVNKPRTRATLNAVLALAPAPGGFTVKDRAGKVHTMTGHPGHTKPPTTRANCVANTSSTNPAGHDVADAGPDRLTPGALTDRTVLVAGGAGAVGKS